MIVVKADHLSSLTLGRQGENLARKVVFDLSDWSAEYGAGTAELIVQRPGENTPYPAAIEQDGAAVTWTLTAADTALASTMDAGNGHCELRWYVGDVLAKSKIWRTWVDKAMDATTAETPPEPEKSWVDQVLSAGIAAENAAADAKSDADRAAALAAEVAEKASQTTKDATAAAQAKEAAMTAQRLAEDAQRAAEAAKQAAETAKEAVAQSATDAEGAKQAAESALKSTQDAAATAEQALSDILALYQEMQTWAQGVVQDVNEAGSHAVQSVQSAGDAQVQRVTDEGTTQTANAKAQADAAALSAAGAAQSAQEAAESAAVYDNVVSDVNQLKADVEHLAPTIVCQSSGNTIALDDSCDRPFCGLNLYGKTTQDGTPSPDAPVELESVGDGGSVVTAVCGKNLFADGKVYLGRLNSSYGEINIGSPVESPVHRKGWAGVGIRVAVSPNNTYTVSSDITPCNYFTVTFYKEFDSVGSKANAISFKEFTNRNNATFTTPENCYCVVITCVSNAESDFTWSWWQVEHGSAATVYEPYEGQTLSISTPNGLPGIPVSSGGNYTDSTGQQWICDEVDFARGVYVQRLYSQIITSVNKFDINAKGLTRAKVVTNKPAIPTSAAVKAAVLSDYFPTYSAQNQYNTSDSCIATNSVGEVIIQISGITDIDSIKSFISSNEVTVLYMLATPIETALSEEELAAYVALHTYKPNTTIYNDAGAEMEVSYQADTKLYIDKQFAEIRSAIISLGGNV